MLTKNSIKKPYSVIVLILIISIIGCIAIFSLPVDLFPDFELPVMVVATISPGGSPEVIEKEITTPIESALRTVNNVKSVTSMSQENVSMVILELGAKADINTVQNDINTQLGFISPSFSEMTMAPIILKMDPSMLPVMTLSLSKADASIENSSAYLEDLAKKIQSVEGVASVNTTGIIKNMAHIQVNPNNMAGGITGFMLDFALKCFNDKPNGNTNYPAVPSNLEPLVNLYSKIIDKNNITGFGLALITNNYDEVKIQEYVNQNFSEPELKLIFGKISTVICKEIKKGADLSAIMNDMGGMLMKVFASLTPEEIAQLGIDPNLLGALGGGNSLAGGFSSMFTPEMLKMVLTAQNFEMPAGVASINGEDLFVKIGESINTWKDLANMPIISMKIGDMLKPIEEVLLNNKTLTAEAYKEFCKTLGSNAGLVSMFYTFDGTNYNLNEGMLTWVKAMPSFTLRLSNAADITSLTNSGSLHTIINGGAGVMLSIGKQPNYSTVDVTKGINKLISETQKKDPSLQSIVLFDQGAEIGTMMKTIAVNLVVGAVFAVIILLIFLRDIKPTLTVAISIVFSVLGTFALMFLTGVSLNLVSMGGLMLAVGMLVDNSIVVIENIYRQRSEGASAIQAAYKGTKQVASAIIGSTVTTVIVFLPIVFYEGITKEIFKDLGLTMFYALGCSLLIALTLVPMVSSRMFNKNISFEAKWITKLKDGYGKALNFALNKKWITISLVLVMFSGTLIGAFFMKKEIFPVVETDNISISATIDGSKIPTYTTKDEAIDDVLNLMSEKFKEKEYVKDVGVEISSGLGVMGFSIGGGSFSAYVNLQPKRKIKTSDAKVELIDSYKKAIDEKYPEYKDMIIFSESSGQDDLMGGMLDASVLNVQVQGNNFDLIKNKSADLLTKLQGIEGLQISSSLKDNEEELKLIVDKDKASELGVYTAQLFLGLNAILNEVQSSGNLRITEDYKSYQIYIYGTEKEVLRWHRVTDSDNIVRRIYLEPAGVNASGALVNNYYAIGIGGKERVYITDGVNNVFKNAETGMIYNGGVGTLKVYSSVSNLETLDLVTQVINLAPTKDANGNIMSQAVSFPIYKILKKESFAVDVNGKTLYRMDTDLNRDIYGIEGKNVYKLDDATKTPVYKISNDKYIVNATSSGDFNFMQLTDGAKFETGVPKAIAKVKGSLTIAHQDGKKYVTLSAKVLDGFSEKKVTKQIKDIVDSYNKTLTETEKSAMSISFTGENEVIKETYSTLIGIMCMAIALIYLVMVAQFQSLKSPLIVMFTIPLAFTGSVLLLLMCNMSLSIFALIGLVLLMGVVVNNGIVFVDYANKLMESGLEKREALIKTAKERIRPILMTALTTIFAMLASLFDFSSGAAAIKPMIVSTVGGLIYSTALTLFFVPIMYDLLNRKNKRINLTFDDDKEDDIEKEMKLNKTKYLDEVAYVVANGAPQNFEAQNLGQATAVQLTMDNLSEQTKVEDTNFLSNSKNATQDNAIAKDCQNALAEENNANATLQKEAQDNLTLQNDEQENKKDVLEEKVKIIKNAKKH
ncbi:MAG: efflux RND transporter permease subunit [Clostridia bacterium]